MKQNEHSGGSIRNIWAVIARLTPHCSDMAFQTAGLHRNLHADTHSHTQTRITIIKDYFSNTVKLVRSDTVTKVVIAVKRAGFYFDKPPKQLKVFNEGAAKVHGSYSTVVCKVVALSRANSYSASNRRNIIVKQRSFLHNSHSYCKDGHNSSISFSVI